MPRCQHCSYSLVFLQKRRKYKCAKCSHIYLQKTVEGKEFQQWNKKQRELDITTIRQYTKQKKLRKRRLLLEIKRFARNTTLEEAKKERKRLLDRQRYARDAAIINTGKRAKWAELKEYHNARKRMHRRKNNAPSQIQLRIDYWKQQQKKLADEMFKKELYKAYKDELNHSVPKKLLCEQLSL